MVKRLPCTYRTGFYRLLCLSLFLLAGGYVCLSQRYIGIVGGAGLTSQVGLRVGLTAEWKLGRSANLSFQPEWTYLQRGNKELIRKLPGDRRYWLVTTEYMAMPMLFKARLDWQPVALYLLAGPEISYATSVQANYDEAGGIYREKLSFDQVDLRRWDMGATFGIGVEKTIRNRKKIFLDFRYYLGLKDLDTDDNSDVFHEGKVLNMGIVFPL